MTATAVETTNRASTAAPPKWFTARDTAAYEVEDYQNAVEALNIEAVRKASGTAPSRIRSLMTPDVVAPSAKVWE